MSFLSGFANSNWAAFFSGLTQKQNAGGKMGTDLGSCRHARRFFLTLSSNDKPCRGGGSLQLQVGIQTQRNTTHRIHLQSSQTWP